MKKKIGFIIFSILLAIFLTSCDEVLSVVTEGKDGSKIVHNYISMISDKVYDESASMKSWRDIDPFGGESGIDMDNLLFKIENKKEKMIVYGNDESAVELAFFDGGYKYTAFVATEAFSEAMDSLSDIEF
ncbi:MAG: hypothetical protein K5917_05470 [Clostridiales bacterium]|nr:hypothetical protein [Clostridiales bacterium]